ncbi:hypothetical protein GIB67_009875 [Kingdonia uniflora]|uniref:Uncharacterized protein n=1 Tax=Kingdonia uniflora TaxID=39325 RepID=A0A7J7L7S2_9MAGN|nr:hypothetical protein GIB67_009875 [Kingdonia uniflora]
MSQGDPSYGQYQSPFILSQPQPQAFSPYYQPYPLTQPQGFQSPNYFQNYLFHGESTQHSQSDANTSIPVEAAAPLKEKRKGRKKRVPVKQRPSVQVPEDAEFLDETDDVEMHWTDADLTCLARVWENDTHKIYKGLNGGNDFKHREAPIGQKLYRKNIASQKAIEGVAASGSGVHALLDELRLEKIQAKEENERRRVEAMQHWQAKIDLEQAKEDRKILEKDLITLSGHQL